MGNALQHFRIMTVCPTENFHRHVHNYARLTLTHPSKGSGSCRLTRFNTKQAGRFGSKRLINIKASLGSAVRFIYSIQASDKAPRQSRRVCESHWPGGHSEDSVMAFIVSRTMWTEEAVCENLCRTRGRWPRSAFRISMMNFKSGLRNCRSKSTATSESSRTFTARLKVNRA
jgi:hypothetical protein